MATYKVLQDIEAEDKLIGPLTLRQFIYAVIAILCAYFCFIGLTKFLPLIIFFLPPMLLFGFLAFPFGHDQPTEVWALARVKFMIIPHKRLWDQSGAKDLVTVTAPKKLSQSYTDNLSQSEVKSRLRTLADTIDSRGWAIKNVDHTGYGSTQIQGDQSDRLVSASNLPQSVPIVNLQPDEDIMDDSSQVAMNFNKMITSAESSQRERLLQEALGRPSRAPTPAASQPPQPPDNFWFMNGPAAGQQPPVEVIAPGTSEQTPITEDEKVLSEALRANKKVPEAYTSHMLNITPLSEQKTPPESAPIVAVQGRGQTPAEQANNTAQNSPEPPDNAKMELDSLAQNKDWSIASIARQVNKPNGEVEISLHDN